MFLWGEATMTTIYVKNRSPHRILKDMTTEEAFSSKKPNVENLRIFRCHVYSHIPKDKRNKLEPSGKKGIFVEPGHEHWIVAKHVLIYICGTINYSLRYTASSDIQLHGFTNSDWAGSAKNRKNTSGMCFILDSTMISWGSRKQKSVTLSTEEVEYMEACEACTKEIWLRKLISDLFDQIPESTIMYCDN
jgi:hypothetical protein